jgi:hypothetical protein
VLTVEGQHACKLVGDKEGSSGDLATTASRKSDKTAAPGHQARQTRAHDGTRNYVGVKMCNQNIAAAGCYGCDVQELKATHKPDITNRVLAVGIGRRRICTGSNLCGSYRSGHIRPEDCPPLNGPVWATSSRATRLKTDHIVKQVQLRNIQLDKAAARDLIIAAWIVREAKPSLVTRICFSEQMWGIRTEGLSIDGCATNSIVVTLALVAWCVPKFQVIFTAWAGADAKRAAPIKDVAKIEVLTVIAPS